jgi:hypothetical protein
MQYILGQEEMDKLNARVDPRGPLEALALAREMIMKHTKHKCIHDKSVAPNERQPYCRFCPIANMETRIASRAICPLSRDFSK